MLTDHFYEVRYYYRAVIFRSQIIFVALLIKRIAFFANKKRCPHMAKDVNTKNKVYNIYITWEIGSGIRNRPPQEIKPATFTPGAAYFFTERYHMKAITLEQFAKMANVSTRTLRRWLKKPETLIPQPFTPTGTRKLFWEHEVKEWLYRAER